MIRLLGIIFILIFYLVPNKTREGLAKLREGAAGSSWVTRRLLPLTVPQSGCPALRLTWPLQEDVLCSGACSTPWGSWEPGQRQMRPQMVVGRVCVQVCVRVGLSVSWRRYSISWSADSKIIMQIPGPYPSPTDRIQIPRGQSS